MQVGKKHLLIKSNIFNTYTDRKLYSYSRICYVPCKREKSWYWKKYCQYFWQLLLMEFWQFVLLIIHWLKVVYICNILGGINKWRQPFFEIFDPSLPLATHFTRSANRVTSPFCRSPLPLSGWRHLWTGPNGSF